MSFSISQFYFAFSSAFSTTVSFAFRIITQILIFFLNATIFIFVSDLVLFTLLVILQHFADDRASLFHIRV